MNSSTTITKFEKTHFGNVNVYILVRKYTCGIFTEKKFYVLDFRVLKKMFIVKKFK